MNEAERQVFLRAARQVEILGDAIRQAGQAMNRFNKGQRKLLSLLQHYYGDQEVRRLLGYADAATEANAPAWVRRVHEQQIEAFGSGNGRAV